MIALLLSMLIVISGLGIGTIAMAKEIKNQEVTNAPLGREILNFNNNWGYFMGDLEGAEASNYDDSAFANITIPHTMRLEKKHCGGTNVYQGIGWYRRYFTVDEAYKNKKINIDFEGVMIDSDIYLNGEKLYTRNGGYIGFSVDITDKVKFGEENVLAVRVSSYDSPDTPPGKPLGGLDFHYYGGIYRDVTMRITDKLYISDALQADKKGSGGVFVRYENVSGDKATINLNTHVINDGEDLSNVKVVSRLIDADGNTVLEKATAPQAFASGADYEFTQVLDVVNPKLWSTDNPYLYRLVSEVYSDGILTDSTTTKIGIRTIDFKPDGFYLNGKKEYLRGGNRHQSYQNIGDAGSNSMQYRDALQLKENGFNAVRATHYPQDSAFLDACDEIGLLVIECQPGWQNYTHTQKFFDNTMRDIREMIRRDRNRPSVILWEASLNETPVSQNWITTAVKTAREEYPGDQLKLVADYSEFNATLYDVCYKVQYKNSGESTIDDRNPSVPFLTREWGDIGGREASLRNQGEERMLNQVNERQKYLNGDGYNDWGGLDYSPRIGGHFLWSWNDYARGYNYTTLGSGTVDIDRNEKYCFYWLKSMQPASRNGYGPMVYIASSNSPTSNLNVQVYSNCDSVSLYQNDTLIGTQTREEARKLGVNDKIMEKDGSPIFNFKLPSFVSGELKAIGNFHGKEVTHSVMTPGDPHRIVIEPALKGIDPVADGSDQIPVYFKVVDENGTVVPTYREKIDITVSGNGTLIGEGIPRIGVQSQRPEGGIGFAFVRTSDIHGDIEISATSGELIGHTTVTTKPYSGEYVPSIPGKEWDEGVEKFEKDVEEYINLAYGKPVQASSEQIDQGNFAINAVDDDESTKWVASGGAFPQWLLIDLEQPEEIGGFHIIWEKPNAVAKYTIETSLDGEEWKTRVDMSKNSTPAEGFNEHDVKVKARYIRLNVLNMPSGSWASVREFIVFPLKEGEEVVPGEIIENDAIRNITASTAAEGRGPEKLRDGITFVDTGWLAAPGSETPQSVTIEFNKPQTLYGNRIYWEKDSTFYTYTLEFSRDGKQWDTAFKDYTVGGQHYKPEEFDDPFIGILFARITLTEVIESSGNPSNKIGMAEWILYGEETPIPEFKEYEYLSDLDWESAKAGYMSPAKDNVYGKSITLLEDGVKTTFEKGLFAEADSEFIYDIDGLDFKKFQSYIGIDNSVAHKGGRVVFRVFVDGVQVYESPAKMAKDNCEYIEIDVAGGKELKLTSTYTQDPDDPDDIEWAYNGRSVWADAKLTRSVRKLVSIESPAAISVPFGTSITSIEGLPKTVNGTIEGEDDPLAIDVNWEPGDYDGNKAGTYTLKGILKLPVDVKNDLGLEAEIKVTVEEKPDPSEPKEYEYLSDLDWESAKAGYMSPAKDNVYGKSITLLEDGVKTTFEKGLFAEADSEFIYDIDGLDFKKFQSYIGIDNSVAHKGGRVVFRVFVDGVQVYESPAKMAKDNCEYIEIDVAGGKELKLTSTYTQNPDDPDDIEWEFNGRSVWADAKLTRSVRKLVSIESPAAISVPFGTSITSIEGLPKTVNGTIKGEDDPLAIDVNWEPGDYDGNKAGTYTLKGILKLPADVKNDLGLEAEIDVTVETRKLVSIENPTDISVSFGTPFASINNLPKTVNGTTKGEDDPLAIDVNWEPGDYDGNKAGIYTLKGKLDMPESVENSLGLEAELKITVQDKKHDISIAPIDGGTATVTPDRISAKSGELITVMITKIEDGKQFKDITVTNQKGVSIETQAVIAGERYTFIMPNSSVTIAVGLEGVNQPDPEVDITALKDLIALAKKYTNDNGKYTEESFNALQEAIQDAKAALDRLESEEELTDALSSLKAAIDSLEEIDEDPDKDKEPVEDPDEDPDKDKDSNKDPIIGKKPSDGKDDKGGLPKTGEALSIVIVLLGVIILSAGMFMAKRKKK